MTTRKLGFIKSCSVALVSILALTQCTSSPTSAPEQRQTPEVTQPQLTIERDRAAQDWLNQAHDANSIPAQQTALVQAALSFQAEQQWPQSAAIIASIDKRQLRPQDVALFALVKAQWLAHNQQWQASIDSLEPLLSQLNRLEYRFLALQQLAASYSQLGHYWQATLNQIEAEQYNGRASVKTSRDAIWHYARQVTQQQLPKQRPLQTKVAGWWRLLTTLHQSNSVSQQQQDFSQWLASYPQHLAVGLVELWQQQQWQQPQQVVVLLPLSGRYAQQGIAVRDGLIAAAAASAGSSETGIQLHFIDTQQTNTNEQRQQITQLEPSHVIGPLLKEEVSYWLDNPLEGIEQLALNAAAETSAPIIQFALEPTQEAAQAADWIAQKSQRSALVFAARTSSAEAMVNAFRQGWQTYDHGQLHVGWYGDSDEMQETVEHTLGISDSKQRIREVKIAAGKIIIDEQERSRADVDAAYLPGDLRQVRLLKPFIDVNQSPFAPPIKVVSNSAIHSRNNHGGDTDLAGIEFSDSPAVLGTTATATNVEQWLQMRDNASLNDARLFAMGYDSIALVQHLPMLTAVPGRQLDGLSGTLQIQDNYVQRRLDWASFNAQAVQPLSD